MEKEFVELGQQVSPLAQVLLAVTYGLADMDENCR